MAERKHAQGRRKRKERKKLRILMSGEWPLFLILTLLLLVAFGLISLFSASYASAYLESGNSYLYIAKQGMFAAVGIVAMFIIATIDYHLVDRFVRELYVFGLLLLAVVHFTCDPLNNATRWLYWEAFPGLPSVQVSEFTKFAMIVLTAHLLCYYQKVNQKSLMGPVLPVLFTIPVVVFLAFQPHLSAIIITCGIVGIMILMSGVGLKKVLVLSVVCSPFVVIGGWYFLQIDYVQARLAGWTLDETKMEWQTMQSVYAIGSGGLTGLGFGDGVQKQMWLPEATNDFIFSVICEELGFVGAMVVLFLFAALLVQGFHIALQAADLYGTLLAIGITAQIGLQFVFNIGVVTSLLPNTGISLPFFSSGGTSLLMLLAEVGVLISVARDGAAARAARAEARIAQELEQRNAAEAEKYADGKAKRASAPSRRSNLHENTRNNTRRTAGNRIEF